MGYRTTLVLSGSTARDDLVRFAYRPDLVIDSIADLRDEATYAQAVGELNGVAAPFERQMSLGIPAPAAFP
jgi:NagD protein